MRSWSSVSIRRRLNRLRGHSLLVGAVVLVIGLRVVLPANAPADSFAFTPIDVPGSVFTVVNAINTAGQIVGYFGPPTGGSHAFLDTGGVLTLVDVPGAPGTVPYGLNAMGQIVGFFSDASATSSSGFLYSGGIFTPLNVPGATGTVPHGINASG